MTRGNKLFNPMNIRINTQKFVGEIQPSSDTAFKQFDNFAHGIRAGCKILVTYYAKYGLNTVTELINRWAPPADNNDTTAYIKSVSQRTGLGPYEAFKVNDPNELELLAEAICHQEQGKIVFTKNELTQGVQMALGILKIS